METIPDQPSNVESVSTTTTVVHRKSYFLPTIIFFLFLLMTTGLAFLIYQNYQLQQQLTKLSLNEQPSFPTNVLTPTPNPTSDWKTYTGSDYSFKYPGDWSTTGLNDHALMIAPNNRVEEVKTLLDRGNGFGGGSFLTVTINEIDGLDGTIWMPDEFTEVTNSSTVLDGLPADRYDVKILQSSPLGNPGDRLVRVSVFHNKRFLVIDLLDDDYQQTFEQLLSTFNF